VPKLELTSNQYVFDMATKFLTLGTYVIRAVLASGQTIEVMISLK